MHGGELLLWPESPVSRTFVRIDIEKSRCDHQGRYEARRPAADGGSSTSGGCSGPGNPGCNRPVASRSKRGWHNGLRKRLAGRTAILIQSPTECWADLAIPPGSSPHTVPAVGHPLELARWWRW